MFGRNKRVIGLDIGTSSVKAVVLKELSRGFQLMHLGIEHLPPEVIVDGAVMDAAIVVDAIQKLIRSQKIKIKDVAISVSGSSVIVKKIPLPRMSEQELEESIQWEAEQYIPFDIEDVNIDFEILDTAAGSESAEMDVVLVAVKKDKVNDYASLATQAGLEPAIVDVDGFALSNQYEKNYGIDPNEIIALIDVGAGVMNINVIQNGVHGLYRDIPVGGNHYTDAIQKDMNVSYDQAESLKVGRTIEGISPQEVQEIINSVNESLAMEIQRSFDYFKATSSNERIDRIVMTGGCSKVKGLPEFLSEKLAIPVERGNPFRNVVYNDKMFDSNLIADVSPMCAVAVGLAMRKVGDR